VLERSLRRLPELPLYEYECPKHGTFERIQKFSDPPLAACPSCGGPIEKLASAPAIQFKGTGWYVTDYARKSSGSESGKDKGASGESGKEKSSSAETKSGSSDAKSTTETKSTSSGTDKK
jgi:putative FmdB family regulatory protein